mmetsp:Transcript_103476/g.223363  ORF Transcript_103476/g.223363 Transcript_103476/m.223363 type:complete len:260 (+) Transcript_103476:1-780(+)
MHCAACPRTTLRGRTVSWEVGEEAYFRPHQQDEDAGFVPRPWLPLDSMVGGGSPFHPVLEERGQALRAVLFEGSSHVSGVEGGSDVRVLRLLPPRAGRPGHHDAVRVLLQPPRSELQGGAVLRHGSQHDIVVIAQRLRGELQSPAVAKHRFQHDVLFVLQVLRAELQGHAIDEDEAHHEVVALAQLWRHPVRWHVVALPQDLEYHLEVPLRVGRELAAREQGRVRHDLAGLQRRGRVEVREAVLPDCLERNLEVRAEVR